MEFKTRRTGATKLHDCHRHNGHAAGSRAVTAADTATITVVVPVIGRRGLSWRGVVLTGRGGWRINLLACHRLACNRMHHASLRETDVYRQQYTQDLAQSLHYLLQQRFYCAGELR
jgi:hypothetical protein